MTNYLPGNNGSIYFLISGRGGNRTHDLRVMTPMLLPTELPCRGPERIRTADLPDANRMLWPTELRAQN